ncbi:MAG: hypothetical protein WD232_01945 [Acidimicrobiales bacterium]
MLLQPIVPVDGPGGSALAAWEPVWGFVIVLTLILVALGVTGRAPDGGRGFERAVLRVPRALERLTGVPGWAATTVLSSIYGLVFAGQGFYTDVAWHVALGRDDDIFTPPHTAIFTGLVIIAAAPLLGILVATVERVPNALRWGGLRIPRSLVPLGVLGVAAVTGFPIDELWHRAYGVDVTMWSPPHLIMILAASFSGLASWLVLADAGVRPGAGETPGRRRWSRGLHVATAALSLMGLSSVQGEFSFGVPQWQQLYHPVLVCLAAGLGLVAIRLVHGRGWALGIAVGLLAFDASGLLGDGEPIETRTGAIYLVSALVVEAVAHLAGTDRRIRFALLSGIGVGTLGLAGEWGWNAGAHQPWTAALLPEAVLVGALGAVATALIGTAVGGAISGAPGRSRLPAAAVALGVLGVLVALAIPAPRQTGDVVADVTFTWVDGDRATVEVALDPPDAAEGARWFTAGSWQWGGRTIAHMEEMAPGRHQSEEPLLLTGRAKALLRLHRGAEMMAVPLRLPADPEYDLPEVAAEDREVAFLPEQQFLQREASDGTGGLATAVLAIVVVLGSLWVGTFAWAAGAIGRRGATDVAARSTEASRPPG